MMNSFNSKQVKALLHAPKGSKGWVGDYQLFIMSVTITTRIFNYSEVKKAIKTKATINQDRTNDEFLDTVFKKFGCIVGNIYVILDCEYYNEYNSYIQLMWKFVPRFFGIEYGSVWYPNEIGEGESSSANAEEVADELELELPEE